MIYCTHTHIHMFTHTNTHISPETKCWLSGFYHESSPFELRSWFEPCKGPKRKLQPSVKWFDTAQECMCVCLCVCWVSIIYDCIVRQVRKGIVHLSRSTSITHSEHPSIMLFSLLLLCCILGLKHIIVMFDTSTCFFFVGSKIAHCLCRWLYLYLQSPLRTF